MEMDDQVEPEMEPLFQSEESTVPTFTAGSSEDYTLFLEAQVNLERLGEISYTRDLKNTNVNSEMYQKKSTRAHEALSQTHLARSLSISFGNKLGNSKINPPISTTLPDLDLAVNPSDNIVNESEQQQTHETDIIVLPVEKQEMEDEDSVSTNQSRSRPLSPKTDKLSRGYSAEGSSRLKRTDSTYDSETSESKELEITIDADPRHPFSITEKVTSEEKRPVTAKKSPEAWKLLDEPPGAPILPLKPAPERLLPIGPTVRLPKKPGSPFFNQSNQSSFSYAPSQFAHSHQLPQSVQPSQSSLTAQSSSLSHVSTSSTKFNQNEWILTMNAKDIFLIFLHIR
uniref:Uncharacterized protein n=1 Tax=Tetranychus urticae TaxID=32264 RepID=T1KKS5_TETUR